MKPSLSFTSVELRVPDLARSLDFYTRQLGFVQVAQQSSARSALATTASAKPILFLAEDRKASSAPRGSAGLFHVALLFPNRPALGAWLRFAAGHAVEFDGFSDHGVSEAIYFSDPDGNGLEFYTDRPREKWPFADGELAMTTQPLAVQSLIADASPPTSTPLAGAHWGHLHLRVINLDRSAAFYSRALGLAVTQGSYPGARFLAADGYHHHLGLNTWGNPNRPQPSGALGLTEAVFAHAGENATHELRDPDGIALRILPIEAR